MSKARDKQVELLKLALTYAEANPDYEIHVCARNDELCDDYAWTDHQIVKVELGWWYSDNERVLVDIDDIRDHLEIVEDRDATIDDAKAVSQRAILIYTGA